MVRFIKLKLDDFKTYKKQEVFFSQEDLVGVIGQNGAGKVKTRETIDSQKICKDVREETQKK